MAPAAPSLDTGHPIEAGGRLARARRLVRRRSMRERLLVEHRPYCGRIVRLIALSMRRPRVALVIWRTVRWMGRLRRFFFSGWRRAALWLAVPTALLWAVDRFVTDISWLTVTSGFAVGVLAAFAVAVWRARSRVVVEAFLDYTRSADGSAPQPALGLNDALVSELAMLRALYQTVGDQAEAGAVVRTGGADAVEATLELQDVSSFLENASTGNATVSLGAISIPIGMIMALLGRLARGPRLTGGLQVVAAPGENGEPRSEVVLTAYYSGTTLESWTVREPLPDYAHDAAAGNAGGSVIQTAAVRGMVEELASRIFSDLALKGNRSWRATRRFNDGLRQYRVAHETRRDRVLRLRAAERAFIEALADDDEFPLARYNLGVVYRELDSEDPNNHFGEAAENAFIYEIKQPRATWQPYYALALTYLDQGRYQEVSSLCDRVVELAHRSVDKSIAFDLKGLADRYRSGNGEPCLPEALAGYRRAVAYALIALARAELTAQDQRRARSLLAHCLADLGVGLAYLAQDPERQKRAYEQSRDCFLVATRLDDSFDARLELGKIAFAYADTATAVREFQAATRIDPTSSAAWAWLATVTAQLAKSGSTDAGQWRAKTEAALARARQTLDPSSGNARQTVDQISAALVDLDEPEAAERAGKMLSVEGELAGANDPEELEERYWEEMDAWVSGHLANRLGAIHHNDRNDIATARGWYEKALRELNEYYGAEARRLGLQGWIAYLEATENETVPQEALARAQQAVATDPLSSWEREMLGRIRELLGDHESAITAYEAALFWRPGSAKLHQRLGTAHLVVAEQSSDNDRRGDAYARAVGHFEAALRLQSASALGERAAAHYALGKAFQSAEQYDRALPHFRNSMALQEARPLAQLMLGESCIRIRRYDAAEDMLTDAIAGAEQAAETDPDAPIGNGLEDGWTAVAVAATAHRLLALSLIERDVRRDEAREHLAAAREQLKAAEYEDKRGTATDYELEGRMLIEDGKHDEAIASLLASVALVPDVEAYFHLARAYTRKAEATDGAERRDSIRLARRALRLASEIALADTFQGPIATVTAQLDELAAEPAAAGGT
jgi:tetratricopeptide (TPR) repeat protein